MPDFSIKIAKMTATEKMEFKAALSRFPGVADLSKMIDAMSSAAELKAMEAAVEIESILTLEFDDFDFDVVVAQAPLLSSPSDDRSLIPSPIKSGSTPITIRIQNRVLAAGNALV